MPWPRPHTWVLLVTLVASIAAVTAAGRSLPVDAWAEMLRGGGTGAFTLAGLGGALATAVGLPRQLVATLAGYAFGAAAGFVLALFAATCGCALTMLCARRWLGAPVRGRWPHAVARLEALLRKDLFGKVVVLRLQPLGTNLITNLCAGVVGVRAGTFLAASCLGYVPQTLVFVLAGAGVRSGSRVELLTSGVLFVVSLGLGGWLVRRHRDAATRTRVAKDTGLGGTD